MFNETMKSFEQRKHQRRFTAPVLFAEETKHRSSEIDLSTVRTYINRNVNNCARAKYNEKQIRTERKLIFVESVAVKNRNEKETSFIDQRMETHHLPLGKKEISQNRRQIIQTKAKDCRKIYQFTGGPAKLVTANRKITNLRKESAIYIVKKFCVTSTIDALQYVTGKTGQILWIILFIIVAGYCFNQCKLNIDTYLRYNVSTKIADIPSAVLDFPAISICPIRMLKKSKFGNQPDLAMALSSFYANTFSEMNSLLDDNKRTCDNHNNLTDEMKDAESITFIDKLKNGLVWTSNDYYFTYKDILLDCIWDRKRIDCSDAILNHVSDVGECFTFNPGDVLAELSNNTKTGYGLNVTKYSESQFTIGRGHRGLKVYFNIKQSEYCGNEILKRGAGIFFQIHGTNRNPSFLINPSTYIGPGYDFKIVMEKQVYKRKTEHLGRCKSFLPLYVTPNISVYVLEHCYMQCAAEHILTACKCYPPNLGGIEAQFLVRVKELGLPKAYVHVCLGNEYVCLRQWIHFNMSTTSFELLCPYCKQPCDETKYPIQMTGLLLSQRNVGIPYFNNVSLSELHKNYLIANFVFKSNAFQLIVEEQAFDLQDLFVYVGNNIGLYLGMSFTTLFELVYFIVQLLSFFWKH